MVDGLLIQLALIVILVRSVYVVFKMLQGKGRNWLEIAFNASIAILALSALF